ncbi:hypothetical protein J6590_107262, partial [Homalodisca vitripennis]
RDSQTPPKKLYPIMTRRDSQTPSKKLNPIMTRRDSQTPTKKLTPKERLPPMTAKIRGDHESLDDFYMKYIDYNKDIIQHQKPSASLSHAKTPMFEGTSTPALAVT